MERADAQVRARPAPGPDGNIYIAVMNGNKIAKFDTKSKTFKEWELPDGARPHGLVVAPDGKIFYTGNGNGSIGELDPATGKVIDHFTPRRAGTAYRGVRRRRQHLVHGQGGGYLGKLDRKSGKVSEIPMPGGPYGLAIDKQGRIWVCRMGANALGIYDPKSGKTDELRTGSSSRPRRIAAAPDGMLWVTYYGNGILAKVDPAAMKVRQGVPDAGRAARRSVHGGGRRRGRVLGERDRHRHRRIARSEDREVPGLPASVERRRHPQGDRRCRRTLLVHGSHNGKLGVIE
jgi:virginiamycin B lyase